MPFSTSDPDAVLLTVALQPMITMNRKPSCKQRANEYYEIFHQKFIFDQT